MLGPRAIHEVGLSGQGVGRGLGEGRACGWVGFAWAGLGWVGLRRHGWVGGCEVERWVCRWCIGGGGGTYLLFVLVI